MATIIIQENDAAILDVIMLALKEAGHNAVGVFTPCTLEFSQKLKECHPDVAMIDFSSAYRTGIEMIETLRAISPNIPIVALSCDLNIDRKASALGFQDFIRKPFDLEDIYIAVNRLLRK